ncbi:hypothetical protein [Escherichia coli]|uniref:hypothetical protein n=1 Tax=Escherichia coli TaxID=562 RepID=UPI0015C354E5|nr:hypothetical protein [Escherichia coli]
MLCMRDSGGWYGGAVLLTGAGVRSVVVGLASGHGQWAAWMAVWRDILGMQQL